jgi:small subunit ribosomal protein S17
MIGVVVSVKMDKTAVVSIEERKPHALYRKIVRSTKRYKAHDPLNKAVLGDVVRIEETRPISKEKRWRIIETMTRGNVAEVAPREIGLPQELIEADAAAAAAAQAAREAQAEVREVTQDRRDYDEADAAREERAEAIEEGEAQAMSVDPLIEIIDEPSDEEIGVIPEHDEADEKE